MPVPPIGMAFSYQWWVAGPIESLFRALRMSVVHRVGNRVIAKRFGIEGAGELQQFGRLLTDLHRWNDGLLARGLVCEAGLPSVEGALRVARPGAPEVLDHRVLIADDRIFV